jgi:hypothetical protein
MDPMKLIDRKLALDLEADAQEVHSTVSRRPVRT